MSTRCTVLYLGWLHLFRDGMAPTRAIYAQLRLGPWVSNYFKVPFSG